MMGLGILFGLSGEVVSMPLSAVLTPAWSCAESTVTPIIVTQCPGENEATEAGMQWTFDDTTGLLMNAQGRSVGFSLRRWLDNLVDCCSMPSLVVRLWPLLLEVGPYPLSDIRSERFYR
jgi:hypothetical protein